MEIVLDEFLFLILTAKRESVDSVSDVASDLWVPDTRGLI